MHLPPLLYAVTAHTSDIGHTPAAHLQVDDSGMRELAVSGSGPALVGSTRPIPAAAATALDPGQVLMSGWLNKQAVSAPTLLKNWRRRYIVLKPHSITWSKAEGAVPAGSLSLGAATKVRVT